MLDFLMHNIYVGLYLSFDEFGSIHGIVFDLSALIQFLSCCFFFSDFQLFRHEYHWRNLSSPNAHLEHQNWFRISFTLFISGSSYSKVSKWEEENHMLDVKLIQYQLWCTKWEVWQLRFCEISTKQETKYTTAFDISASYPNDKVTAALYGKHYDFHLLIMHVSLSWFDVH
jgi:hypothetical protein